MYITLDVGGTKARFSFFKDLNPDSQIATHDISSEVIKEFESGIVEIVKLIKGNTSETIEGIGITFSGVVDSKKGIVLDSQFFPNWNNKPLAERLSKEFNTQVKVEHDGITAALAEKFYGKAKDSKYFAFISIGTGIGGTIVRERKDELVVYPTELGHMVVQLDGFECACGHRGCVEAYASGSAIQEIYNSEAKNVQDTESWVMISRYLSQTIMNLIALHNVESIYFSGGLAANKKELLELLIKQVEDMIVINSQLMIPEFVISDYFDKASTFGALALLNNKNKYIKYGLTS